MQSFYNIENSSMFVDAFIVNQIVKIDVTTGGGKEMGTSIYYSLIIGEGSMLFRALIKHLQKGKNILILKIR